MKKTGLIAVVKRECRILTSRPLFLFTTLLFPLFALVFMTNIFGNGMIDKIPVAIVDEDFSKMSRDITRLCSAVPEIHVTQVLHNTAEARDKLLAKEIYAYLIIPHDFQNDVMANRDTELVLCYHYAFLSVGSEVMQGFLKTLKIIAVTPIKNITDFLGIDNASLEAVASPINVISHPLYNPSLDYSEYLSFPYFWVLFQILVLLNIAYSFGNDFKEKKINECLSTAGNSFTNMTVGKLIPYIIIFSIITIFSNIMIFKILNITTTNNIFGIIIVSILFIYATSSVSLFIFSLYPKLPIIISFISMFGSLGATFAGVTFPVNAMFTFFEKMASLFPIRHFIIISDYLRYEESSFLLYRNSLIILICYNILIIISIAILKRKYQHCFSKTR